MDEINKRILVADDEEVALIAARENFRQFSCSVDCAHTGEEAVRLVARKSYNLILLDIDMFDMDGFNVAKRIRKMEGIPRDVPIIAVTARIYNSLKKRAKELGFRDYIAKPLNSEKCREILAALE